MPFYEYEPDDSSRSCDHCREGYEVMQGIRDDPQTACPRCGAPVHRVLSTFSFQQGTESILSPKNLERHGFTQYRRSEKGVYEKSAGLGPRVIKDDR